MKTAIDSSVLFAIFNGEKSAAKWVEKLAAAKSEGTLVIVTLFMLKHRPGFLTLPVLTKNWIAWALFSSP